MADRTFHYSDRVKINYRVQGDGPVTLVFLHGFAAALTTWDDLAPLFPPERFTLYLLDLKGFGFSSKPGDGRYRLEDQAEIVTAFLEHEGLANVVLVGHSLGGGIALITLVAALAARKEGLIGRLVLMDCAAYPQEPPLFFRLLRPPLIGRFLMAAVPLRLIVEANLTFVYHDRRTMTDARVKRYMHCFSRRGAAAGLIRTARQLEPAAYEEFTAGYRSIALPTLVIWGEYDRVVPLACGRRLAAEIHGARLVVIPSCGHNPHEERPEETFAAIASFLAATD